MTTNIRDRDEDDAFLRDLERRDIKAFVRLYKGYHENFLIMAYAKLDDRQQAIAVVQDFFEELWINENFLDIGEPLYGYLIRKLESICELKRLK